MDLPNRGYISWHEGLPGDNEPLILDLDELDNLPKQCHLQMTPAQIISCVKSFEREQVKRRQATMGRAVDVKGD